MYIIHIISSHGTIELSSEAGDNLPRAVWQGQDLARQYSMQLLTNASAEQETLTMSIYRSDNRETVWREVYT